MMLRGIYVMGATVIAGAVLVVESVPRPEGFWPVTVTGWVSLLLSSCAVAGVVYGLWKFSLKDITTGIGELKAAHRSGLEMQQRAFSEAMMGQQTHFDDKITAIQEKYDERIETVMREQAERMNSYTRANDERMNSFGERVRANEDDFEVLNRLMAASQEDRRHINEQLVAIRVTLEKSAASQQQFERDFFKLLRNNPRS